jgi:hypothetical protein
LKKPVTTRRPIRKMMPIIHRMIFIVVLLYRKDRTWAAKFIAALIGWNPAVIAGSNLQRVE